MSDVRTLSNASTVDNIRSIFGNAVSRYADVNFPFDIKFSSKSLSVLKSVDCANFPCFLQCEIQRTGSVAVTVHIPPFTLQLHIPCLVECVTLFLLVYQRGKLQSCSFNALRGNHLFVTFI